MRYRGLDITNMFIHGELLEENNEYYIYNEEFVNNKLYGRKEMTKILTKVDSNSICKCVDEENDIYVDDVLLTEGKLILVSDEKDLVDDYIVLGNIHQSNLLEMEIGMATTGFEGYKNFIGKKMYNYGKKFEIVYRGEYIIIFKNCLEGGYHFTDVKLTYEPYIDENEWTKWRSFDLWLCSNSNIEFHLRDLFEDEIKYRIRNDKEIKLKGVSKCGKTFKVSCKVADGDEFSIDKGIEICLYKMLAKYCIYKSKRIGLDDVREMF